MRVYKISSSLLRVFIVGVCCCGVLAGEELDANNVKYEFGARLPKRDLVGQADRKQPVYTVVPKQSYQVSQVQKPFAVRVEQKQEGLVRTKTPQTVITEHITLPTKRRIRPRIEELPKLEIQKVEVPELQKAEVTKVKWQKLALPKNEVSKSEVSKLELPKSEVPKLELPKPELSKHDLLKSEVPSLKQDIIQTIAEPQPPLIETQTKIITKPRKLKKYPLYYSTTNEADVKDAAKQLLPPNVKVLQKPIAFSFTKDKTQDNMVAAGTEVQANKKSNDPQEEKEPKQSASENIERNIKEEHNEEPPSEQSPKEESSHFKKGGGSRHHSGHYSEEGDEGSKKYDGHEDYEKAEKGKHDKEGHKGEYEEDAGHNKHHHHDDDHHSEHHKAEEGKKSAEYDEHGKFSKGWSTKGEHNIHRLDDYEKKKVFFDESHDEGDEEDEGEYYEEKEFEKGSGGKGAHHDSGRHKDYYAKEGIHKKGGHYYDRKGLDKDDKHAQYYNHHAEHGRKGGDHESKKWGQQHQQQSQYSHPVHHHREPTRHIVWVGERSDHDVANTQHVPTTAQKSQKGRKTKCGGGNKKKRGTQRVSDGHKKREANAQLLNAERNKKPKATTSFYNDRYYFVINH